MLLVDVEAEAAGRAVTVTLDAQAVAGAGPHDELRLSANGSLVGAVALAPGRTVYAWQMAPGSLRPGLNEIGLETTRTSRPGDVTPGGDSRLLGLAAYGVRLTAGRDAPNRPAP